MSQLETCKSCKFYENHYYESGSCLKHAPVIPLRIVEHSTYQINGVWPTVRTSYWCGDYEAKE